MLRILSIALFLTAGGSATAQRKAPASPAPSGPSPMAPGPLQGEVRFVGYYDGEQDARAQRPARANTRRGLGNLLLGGGGSGGGQPANRFGGSIVFDMNIQGSTVTGQFRSAGELATQPFTGTRIGNYCTLTTTIWKTAIEGTCDETGFNADIRSGPRDRRPWTARVESALIDVKDGRRYYAAQHLNPVTGRLIRSENFLRAGFYSGKLICEGRERTVRLHAGVPDYQGQRGKIAQFPPSNGAEFDVEIVTSPDGSYRVVPTSSIGENEYVRRRDDTRLFGATLTKRGTGLGGSTTDPDCSALGLVRHEGPALTMDPQTFDKMSWALVDYIRAPKGDRPCAQLAKSGIPGHLECIRYK